MPDLKKDVQDACAAALAPFGFVVKRRRLLLQLTGSKEVTGWLGLNLATWSMPKELHVNPVVGVRFVRLEKALVKYAGWPAPVASVAWPLGYLMPQKTFTQWDFPLDGDRGAVAADLAKAVSTYGQPFIDHWSNWRTFSQEIADTHYLAHTQRTIVLPVIAYLNGEYGRVEELVQEELDRIGDGDDVYSKSFRAFAEKLTRDIST